MEARRSPFCLFLFYFSVSFHLQYRHWKASQSSFEGLTLDRNTNTLWALLQSATIQDSNKGSKTTIRYTRILGYDVSNVLKPKLVHEYVVPLPISSKGNVRKASELHIVDSETFLILSRDGSGFGDTDPKSTFKQADLISTKNATDIANTKYDEPANPISPNGVLVSDITPVQYQSFVDLVNKYELAKFGLQSGGAFDKTLIASKLESLALASCQDSKNPNDYFLFVVSDNDFITQNGFQASQVANGSYVVEPYSDPYPGGSADTQAFIYRVTLPINGRAQPGYN
ncbi:hypothetical protein L7F22_010476 [Adiantum nelumboides]|nr:hypothetical protein [Adiantum nelumboides]